MTELYEGSSVIDPQLAINSLPLDTGGFPAHLNYKTEEKAVSLVHELSPDSYILDMIHELNGEIKNREGEYVKIKGIQPLMNEEGITLFFHLATSALNQITTYSNYRDDTKLIYRLVKKVLKDATSRFFFYRKELGIENKAHISIILDKLQGVVLSAYFKALGAGDRKAATSNITENISTFSRMGMGQELRPQARQGGFISKMLGRN